jgi:archaellum component FlaC
MLIGMASGQTIVLSAGRRRLSHQLSVVAAGQTAIYDRVNALESLQGGQAEVADAINDRLDKLEAALPGMISRAEVENAFAQVAQIEAQRQNAAMQQARAQSVFGGKGGAPVDLNTAINAQLSSLSDRINRINQEFGVG